MSPKDKRALSRAIHTMLRLGVEELEAGNARKIEGAGWVASRYPSQGRERPGTDIIRIEIRVGSEWDDRFGGGK